MSVGLVAIISAEPGRFEPRLALQLVHPLAVSDLAHEVGDRIEPSVLETAA